MRAHRGKVREYYYIKFSAIRDLIVTRGGGKGTKIYFHTENLSKNLYLKSVFKDL